ncbi:MAG TPA: hypothetical protein VN648_35485 [Candidatus Methylomirabilis sp.]|nr:hypothetical protein [Candidatus Methylomirabilis sp.]
MKTLRRMVTHTNFKTWGLASLLGGLVLTALMPAIAQAQCSSETIFGTYAFRISGVIYGPGGKLIQRDGVALTRFDGVGGLTQEDFVMSQGTPLPGHPAPDGFHDREWGTYVVSPDCTGSAVINFPAPPGGASGAVINLMFVIGHHGETIHTIVSQVTPPGSSTPMPANIHSDAERVDMGD